MNTCKICSESFEAGTLHACRAPSLHAPWLQGMLEAANKPLLEELGRIRALLQQQSKPEMKPPAAETKAQKRETR